MKNLVKEGLNRAKEVWNRFAELVKLPPVPIPNLDAPPQEGEGCVLKVPMAKQVDGFSCGVVAGWTVIKSIYPGRGRQDFVNFYEDCNPHVERGTTTSRLVRALRAHGVSVSLRSNKPSFGVFTRALDGGLPVIACINIPDADCAHWVTVYGYKKGRRRGGNSGSLYLHNNGRPLVGGSTDRVMDFKRFQALQVEEYLICRGKR